MSVRFAHGVIHLAGRCLAEDAEPLLLALQDHPHATVALSEATRLHMAVVQVLLAARVPIADSPQSLPAVRFLLAGLT